MRRAILPNEIVMHPVADDRKIQSNLVLVAFHSSLKGRVGPACSIGPAPNPRMPLPDQRFAEVPLKHAGR